MSGLDILFKAQAQNNKFKKKGTGGDTEPVVIPGIVFLS